MPADDRVKLRAVEPSDIDFLYNLENGTERSSAAFGTAPLSRLQLSRYIDDYSADIYADKQLRLVIVAAATRESVGAIDITDFDARDRRGFVGIAVAEKERGKGYGTAALQLLCLYAMRTLGLHSLAAVVGADNVVSQKLFAGCGFRHCGNLREWVREGRTYGDAGLWQLVFTEE